ncbi:MAG TPA: hypothetical protein VMU66_06710, partial [Gaiellales bacterium]|nr:hypothetical protein [Gaiellales bacterium]
MTSLGRWVYRRRRLVVAVWLVAMVVLVPLAPRLQSALASGGFVAQDSEAVHAGGMLQHWLPRRPRAQLVVVSATADVAAFRRAVEPALRVPHVVRPGPGGLRVVRSTRGTAVYAVLNLDVNPDS